MSEDKYRWSAHWIARLHSEDRKSDDDRAFRAWLNEHPENAARFEHASTMWDDVGGLKGEIERTPVSATSLFERRQVLAGGAAMLLAGGGLFHWSQARATTYQTSVGEQRRLTLADGSRLFLDTDTLLRFRESGQTRDLTLERGRIHSDIARDGRPFTVTAGARALMAASGKFDIKRDAEQLSFAALDGTARIFAPDTPESAATLIRPGDRFVMRGGNFVLDRPDMRDLTAWQMGRIAFRNHTLAQAVAEMNRYSEQHLIVNAPELQSMHISGVYSVGDNARFARTLAEFLPVKVRVTAEEIYLSPQN